jgi:hypothetical protein
MYNINMNSNISKLPKSFGVKTDNSHPRWRECISMMNESLGDHFYGNGYKYYGMTKGCRYDGHDDHSAFAVILSIDEFFQMIEGSREITTYSIY